ncbi:MAG: VWA-like domain-containing protein, partial [Thermovenabulum sp.]
DLSKMIGMGNGDKTVINDNQKYRTQDAEQLEKIADDIEKSHKYWDYAVGCNDNNEKNKTYWREDVKGNEKEWKERLIRAANVARQRGTLPASLQKIIDEILNPTVDYRILLQDVLEKINAEYNWNTFDRRYISRGMYLPGKESRGARTVVIALDTSGSITDEELNNFVNEVYGIVSLRYRDVYVIACDAEIHEVYHIDEYGNIPKIKNVSGRGGTDFRPVFNYVKENCIEPTALIYYTDGEGTYPTHDPGYPTIWVVVNEVDVPFGRKVMYKKI